MKHTHAKERKTVKDFFRRLYLSYIPNGKDNIKQIIIKVFFLISLITLIVSASYLANYFLSAKKQDNIIKSSRNIRRVNKHGLRRAAFGQRLYAERKQRFQGVDNRTEYSGG